LPSRVSSGAQAEQTAYPIFSDCSNTTREIQPTNAIVSGIADV
jgi:hypothetical protein